MSKGIIARSEYLAQHEAFLIHVDLSDYLIDYYHHRQQYAPKTLAEHDEKLKELITCFAIHLMARASLETHAWTVHLVAEHPYSLFVTGHSGEPDAQGIERGFIVGHVLSDHIRHTDVNAIHGQCTNRGSTSKSLVRCDTSDVAQMIEQFYVQSEQRPFKVFVSPTSDTAIGLVTLLESEKEWLESVDLEALYNSQEIERKPMRSCTFAFSCDCSPAKLTAFFKALPAETLSELYGGDEELTISCPRCGKQLVISREEFEQSDGSSEQ